MPEPAAGVQLEISYEPNERTFTIQSRFDQGASWSLHVVGSMRGERTESGFATSSFETETSRSSPDNLKPVDIDAFYRYMSDLGLRYGEEFRSVRELSAPKVVNRPGGWRFLNRLRPRAGEYPLHPGAARWRVARVFRRSLDGRSARLAAQIAGSISAAFFSCVLPEPPHESAPASCNARDEFVEGRIGLYDESGKPCVLVDGFRAISVAGVRRDTIGGSRDVLYHVDWQRTPPVSAPGTLEPLPLTRLREAAQAALDDVIATRGRERLKSCDCRTGRSRRGPALRWPPRNGSYDRR